MLQLLHNAELLSAGNLNYYYVLPTTERHSCAKSVFAATFNSSLHQTPFSKIFSVPISELHYHWTKRK